MRRIVSSNFSASSRVPGALSGSTSLRLSKSALVSQDTVRSCSRLENQVRARSSIADLQSRTKLTPLNLSLAEGLLKGDRVCLSRAITLVESTNHDHSVQAEALIEHVLSHRRTEVSKRTFRLGITGPPGAGKSSFIETLGSWLIENKGYRVAVVCIDPSSVRTHGSLLGDKTRMSKLSSNLNAYVRPSPSRGQLGGITQHTNDVALLAEAAGYDVCIVETVGLGQSEIAVDDCVDMLALVLPPANGDELQGVKKGIMEVADMVVVNKADGALEDLARHTAVDYAHALQLSRRKRPEWRPRVRRCSSLTGADIDTVWSVMEKFWDRMEEAGELKRKRKLHARTWMWANFADRLVALAKEHPDVVALGEEFDQRMADGVLSPRHAARDLVAQFLESTKKSQSQ